MALTTAELQRIRYECGYNVEGVGAEPYISYVAVFNQIVQAFLEAGSTTTSSTTVTPATPPAPASPVALTLASATGFAAGDRVVIDVDVRQEITLIQSMSGSVITVDLVGPHSGTYPVTQEGGESIVRDHLRSIMIVRQSILRARSVAGIAAADEVKWFQRGKKGNSRLRDLLDHLAYYQDELAVALGVVNLRSINKGSSGGVSPVLY